MQLTKEYFDQGLQNLIEHLNSKFDNIDQRFESVERRFENIDRKFESIDKRFEIIDQRFESVDNKFEAQTRELKQYVRESFGAQQTYMEERFEEIKEALDVRGEIAILTHDVHRIKQKIGMKK